MSDKQLHKIYVLKANSPAIHCCGDIQRDTDELFCLDVFGGGTIPQG
jgi:hypothetical protein